MGRSSNERPMTVETMIDRLWRKLAEMREERDTTSDRRDAIVVAGNRSARLVVDGRELISFAGNDYLGLARHPEVIEAAIHATERYGTSAAASRVTSGTLDLHLELEARLADFFATEAACVSASGYLAGFAIGEALTATPAGRSGITVDDGAHPCLTRGLASRETSTFRHFDPDDLDRVLATTDATVVAVDGMTPFGAVAPLDRIVDVFTARREPSPTSMIIVDDAHGAGLIGPDGRGTPDHFGIASGKCIQIGSLAKAFGSSGGFVVGTNEFVERVRATSAYRAGTGLAPAASAAAMSAVHIARREPERRRRALTTARHLATTLRSRGIDVDHHIGPVLGLGVDSLHSAAGPRLHHALRDRGFLVPFVHYPATDVPGRFRLTVTAVQEEGDVAALAATLIEFLA